MSALDQPGVVSSAPGVGPAGGPAGEGGSPLAGHPYSDVLDDGYCDRCRLPQANRRHSLRLLFNVYGTPAPQGSKRGYVRGGRVQLVESSTKVKPWREAVKTAARDYLDGRGIDGVVFPTQALSVTVIFNMPRPQSHYRTGRHAHLLRDNAPRYCLRKPDIDKCLRSTLDALGEAAVYRDDSQVVALFGVQLYDELAGAQIEILEAPARLP